MPSPIETIQPVLASDRKPTAAEHQAAVELEQRAAMARLNGHDVTLSPFLKQVLGDHETEFEKYANPLEFADWYF